MYKQTSLFHTFNLHGVNIYHRHNTLSHKRESGTTSWSCHWNHHWNTDSLHFTPYRKIPRTI